MPLLSPNQQCQSTEGKLLLLLLPLIIIVIITITFDNELCDCAIVFLCSTRYLEKLWLELDEIFRVDIQYVHWANLQAYWFQASLPRRSASRTGQMFDAQLMPNYLAQNKANFAGIYICSWGKFYGWQPHPLWRYGDLKVQIFNVYFTFILSDAQALILARGSIQGEEGL